MRIELEIEKNGGQLVIETSDAGRPLLDILRAHQIYIDAPCGGHGRCGRCAVQFLAGAPAAEREEREALTGEERERGIRLACVVRPNRDCRIILPARAEEKMEVLATSAGAPVPETGTVHAGRKKYGIAIDIGTTTLAASLLDLDSGVQKAVMTSVNHQRAYGADVISRIQCANAGSLALLCQSIRADVVWLMEQLVRRAEIVTDDVVQVVMVGNTTMCHLLRGLSCEGLGRAPFAPVDISLWEGICSEMPGMEDWTARLTIFPGISAFVGGDIVAGIYACSMDSWEKPGLLLDLGTNGEMVFGGKDGFHVTSAAAGPVFEGGNISCGVPGIPGAITHMSLLCRSNGAGAWYGGRTVSSRYETIGQMPPVGLCGTAIIDAVSELLRTGMIDGNGTLVEPWFEHGIPLAGEELRFVQRDVREVQMGKAAISAAIETLLAEHASPAACVDMPVCLAGGFGYAMDVRKAIRIGLFPQSFAGCIRPVGNSALQGAKKFLLAKERAREKERLHWITTHAREINLAMHPEFNERYLAHMLF